MRHSTRVRAVLGATLLAGVIACSDAGGGVAPEFLDRTRASSTDPDAPADSTGEKAPGNTVVRAHPVRALRSPLPTVPDTTLDADKPPKPPKY